LDDAKDEYHDGDDKQNMNQPTHRVRRDHSQHPEYERNDDNSYKHIVFLEK
jgi:hypothetical protein